MKMESEPWFAFMDSRACVRGFKSEPVIPKGMQTRRSRPVVCILVMLLASTMPLSHPPQVRKWSVAPPQNLNSISSVKTRRTMTPFENELNGIFDKGVSQSVQGTEEIASWSINWKRVRPSPNPLGD